jgi:hypothetical protein
MGVALERLPNFILYNPLNIWGLQRDLPQRPRATFHEWYKQNREGVRATTPDPDPGAHRDKGEDKNQPGGGAA